MKFGFPVAGKPAQACIAVFLSPGPEKGGALSGLASDIRRFHGRFFEEV